MALRSGYYGVKGFVNAKLLGKNAKKLNDVANAWDKPSTHESVTAKGLGFNFMRKDNVVLVEFVGEATEAIPNDGKIVDIPDGYTMGIYQHAFTLYKNNISGGPVGLMTIKADGIYANTPIAIGDKPRGSFTYAYEKPVTL